MIRDVNLTKREASEMPTDHQWGRVARRFRSRMDGKSNMAFSSVFSMLMPGDIAMIEMPSDPKKRMLALAVELKASQKELGEERARCDALLQKGPWVLTRADLFRQGVGPIKAYEQALEVCFSRLEYLAIKGARLKELKSESEDRLIRRGLQA